MINYDLPTDSTEYVHRIGRTGRIGNKGRSTSFYDTERDEKLARHLVRFLSEVSQFHFLLYLKTSCFQISQKNIQSTSNVQFTEKRTQYLLYGTFTDGCGCTTSTGDTVTQKKKRNFPDRH